MVLLEKDGCSNLKAYIRFNIVICVIKVYLEQKNKILMNLKIYDKFNSKHQKRRYSTYALAALTRFGMGLLLLEEIIGFISKS